MDEADVNKPECISDDSENPSLSSTPRIGKLIDRVQEMQETPICLLKTQTNILRHRANSLSGRQALEETSDDEQEDELEESREEIIGEIQREYDKKGVESVDIELKIDKIRSSSAEGGKISSNECDPIKELEKNELNSKLVDLMKKNSSIGKSNLINLSLKVTQRKDGQPRR